MIGGVLLGMASGFLLGDAGSGVSLGSALGVLLGTLWERHLP
ncbi:hypothetical protein [Deinococcus planocerae]|nr:hypothetical protein [Deinococcus planocerae]